MLCSAYCCWQLKGWTLKARASSSMMSTRPSRPFCSLRPLSRDLHRNLVTRSVVKECMVLLHWLCMYASLWDRTIVYQLFHHLEANYSSSLRTNPCSRFQRHHPWHTGLNTFAVKPIFPWVPSPGKKFAEVSAGYLLWCRRTAELYVLNDEWHLPMHINRWHNSSVAVNVLTTIWRFWCFYWRCYQRFSVELC